MAARLTRHLTCRVHSQPHHAGPSAVQVAETLEHLHSHSVVHRDLKPENILFTRGGRLKLTDFGLAHHVKGLSPENHLMHTCCGTPHYVAPEVLLGHGYGPEVDFWSLGVILYMASLPVPAARDKTCFFGTSQKVVLVVKPVGTVRCWDFLPTGRVPLLTNRKNAPSKLFWAPKKPRGKNQPRNEACTRLAQPC